MKGKKVFGGFLVILILVTIVGCGNSIDYSLPSNPIEFNSGTFVDPADKEETYLSIEYKGRTYIPFGDLKKHITGKDVGKCLGYYVQDGEKDEQTRFFLLNDDTDENILVRIDTEGFMSQPDFFRAVDTKGDSIYIPEFIEISEELSYWKDK